LSQAAGAVVLPALDVRVGGGAQRGQGAHRGALEEQAACHCEQRFEQRRRVASQLGAGRAGMGGGGDGVLPVGGQSVLQLVGEQQVGQLRLPVGGIPVVAVFPLQIVEVDRGGGPGGGGGR